MGHNSKRRRMPHDEQRLAVVRALRRRPDGTVGVRAVARQLGTGKDAARRLLQIAGLYRDPPPRRATKPARTLANR